MNVVQLQDMLRGLPDDRLKQELSQPTGTVPQYLVLSEVVRRDKIRESAAAAPQTTVVQDIIGTPTAPQAFANGGFISPAQSMANAGVRGFTPQPPKPPMQFGMDNRAPNMFTPNTTPQASPPVTNNNISIQNPSIPMPQPQFDGGQQDGPNAPSYYEQPNGYADGGIIGLADGSFVNKLVGVESGFDPMAKNPRSSAAGLGQFIDSTWLQYLKERQPGLVDRVGEREALRLKFDPEMSRDAIDWYKGKNAAVLSSAGYEPSEGNLYLAHFLGGQGAKKILGADPDAPASSILGEGVIRANPFLKNMTAADVANWSNRKMGAAQPEPVITPAAVTAQDMGEPQIEPSITAPSMSYYKADIPQPEPSVAMNIMNPADREFGILSGGVMPEPQERGIGSLLADALGSPDAKKGMRELGSSLFARGQEKQEPLRPPPMQRGDPRLVQNIGGQSVDDILARYRTLRQQYMAEGGAVRMAGGSEGPVRAFPAVGRGPTPEQMEQIRREEELRLLESEAEGFRSLGLPPSVVEERRRQLEQLRPTEGTNGQAGVIPAPAGSRTGPRGPMGYYAEDGELPSRPGDLDVGERMRRAREISQREEAARLAAQPSDLDKYLDVYKQSQDKIAQMYRDQAESERARQEEAGGLPFLLRQLGIGMIATGGPLGEGFRGGLQQAFAAREEQTQAARDRIRELQLKGQMTDVEAANELAKLRYQAAVDARKAAMAGAISKEKFLEEANKLDTAITDAIGQGATPESIAEMRQLAAMYRSLAGLGGTISSAGTRYDPVTRSLVPAGQ